MKKFHREGIGGPLYEDISCRGRQGGASWGICMKIYPTEGNWGRRVWAKRFHTQGGWGVCMRAFHSIDLGGLLPQGTKTGFSLRTTSRLPIPCEHGVLGLLTSPGDTTSRVDVKGCGSCATARRFPRSPQGSAAISFRSQKHSCCGANIRVCSNQSPHRTSVAAPERP